MRTREEIESAIEGARERLEDAGSSVFWAEQELEDAQDELNAAHDELQALEDELKELDESEAV